MIRKAIHDHMLLNDLSAQDVADRCGLSVNTVHNILSGKTHNPNIDTCAMIARGLGISLDFIAGLEFAQKIVDDPTPTEQMPPIAQPPIVPTAAPGLCPHHDALVSLYERTIASKDRWIRSPFIIVILLALFITGVLIFDLTHSGWGYLRT
jgi:transcriptional regulator with XRE-family HTH domain